MFCVLRLKTVVNAYHAVIFVLGNKETISGMIASL